MSFSIEIFPNDKAVLSVQNEDKQLFLLYRRIAQYNKDLTKTNTEDVSVLVNNQMIIGTVTAYKGQTGIIFVWDLEKNRIIHVSDGEYAIRAALLKNTVYSLHFVSYWGKKPEFQLRCLDLGIKDPHKSPKKMTIPPIVVSHAWPVNGKVEMKEKEGNLCLVFDDEEFFIKLE